MVCGSTEAPSSGSLQALPFLRQPTHPPSFPPRIEGTCPPGLSSLSPEFSSQQLGLPPGPLEAPTLPLLSQLAVPETPHGAGLGTLSPSTQLQGAEEV